MQHITRLHDELVRRGKHILGFGGTCQTCQVVAMRLRRKQAA